MLQSPSLDLFTITIGLGLLYILGGAVYRLHLSPIAGFPGPKLAALTYWYETYYDVVRKGRYAFKIEEMHRKYGERPRLGGFRDVARALTHYIGPIVRINPHELVIKDLDYYSELYVNGSTRRTDAYSGFLVGMNLGGKSLTLNRSDF